MLTVSNVGTAAVPDTLILAGLKLQLAFAGSPVQAKVTAPEKPAAPVTLMGALTVWPALTVKVVFPPPSGARVKAAFTTWLSDAEDVCVLASPEYDTVMVCVPVVVKEEVVYVADPRSRRR